MRWSNRTVLSPARLAPRKAAGAVCAVLVVTAAMAAPGGAGQRLLPEVDPDDEDRTLFVLGNTLFTLYHELGHALISELGLPVLGHEEDAVDAFAALMMIPKRPEPLRDQLIVAAADGWAMFSETAINGESPLWGEHALDAQRYYATVCLMVGSDPQGFYAYAVDAGMPDDRIAACPEEYRRAKRSWERLLAPHRRMPDDHGSGVVHVRYGQPGLAEDGLDRVVQTGDVIERALDALTTQVALPRDLTVRFMNCPGPDAYWQMDRGEVVICYQLLAEFESLLLNGQRF